MRPDAAVDCCNGQAERRIAELAAQSQQIQDFAMPTRVTLLREAAASEIAADPTVNCCNGLVGRRLDVAVLVARLASTAEQE